MKIQGTIQPADYVAAQRLNLRPGIGLELPELLFILAGLVAALVFTPWFLAVIAAYIAAWYFVYFPFVARRRYYRSRTQWIPMQLQLLPGGVLLSPQAAGEIMPWRAIHKWRSNGRLTLIYATPEAFLMVPRHFFTDAAAYRMFVAALSSNLGKQR